MNVCKCHNIPPPTTIIKKEKKKKFIEKIIINLIPVQSIPGLPHSLNK
jgi:hypothetical protein